MNDQTPFQQRRLHRSLTDRYVAGVLGGVAETYGWNSTLVRLIFLASVLFAGMPIIVYLAAWIIMPNG